MARVARSVSKPVSKPVSTRKPRRVSKSNPPALAIAPPDEDEEDEREDDEELDVEEEGADEQEEDPEEIKDEVDEAERELADDPELSALRTAVRSLAGVTHEITVRERYSGPVARMKALLTYRGAIALEQIESVASLDAAVRLHMNGKPGLYLLRLEDPVTHKPVHEWQHAVRVAGAEIDRDLDEIRRRTERVKASKQLAEAEAELEEVRELRKSPRTDRLVSMIEKLHARLAALEQPKASRFDTIAALLSAPLVVTMAEKLLGRLFAPPPSPTDTIKHLVPLLQANLQAQSEATLLEKKAQLRHRERLLESKLRRDEAEAGVEPDQPNWLQQTLAIVQAFRGGAPATPAAAAGPGAATTARVVEHLTPFARFAARVIKAYRAKASPIDAVESALEAWEAIPPALKQQFLDPSKALNLFATLPAKLRAAAQQCFDGEAGMVWLREMHEAIVDMESPDTVDVEATEAAGDAGAEDLDAGEDLDEAFDLDTPSPTSAELDEAAGVAP